MSKPVVGLGLAILLLGSVIWRIAVGALVIFGIVTYIWGGTNDAHIRCLDHRFGDTSMLSTLACAAEH